MKINDIIYTSGDAQQLINAYKDYVIALRIAIKEHRIPEFFSQFGNKPRYLEIVDVLLQYPDGITLALEIYEYVITNISGNKIPSLIESLFRYEAFRTRLIRDFEYLFNQCLTKSAYKEISLTKLIDVVSKIPDFTTSLQPKMVKIIAGIHRLTEEAIDDSKILQLILPKLSIDESTHKAIPAIVHSGKDEYLIRIIQNLLKQEKVDDFTSIGGVSWSTLVFKIGTQVLKIGHIRANSSCPEDFRVIDPLQYEIIYSQYNSPILYIERQEFLSQENITNSDIEDFLDDVKSNGKIYTDNKGDVLSNFGVLNDITPVKLKYGNLLSKSFLAKPVVLLDRDFFWNQNDPNIKYSCGP